MILDREFPPDIRVEKEINVLTKNNYNVHILTFTKKNAKKIEVQGKLTIHRKTISEIRHKTSVGCLLFPFYFNFWNQYIKEITTNYKFDAIHIHDLPLSKTGYKWAKILDIPLILDLHENWPSMLEEATHTNTILGKILSWNSQWVNYEKEMVSKANAVITVVEEMKNRVSKFSNQKDKFFVYQNVPELKSDYLNYSYNLSSTNEIKIVYLGGLNVNRGLQTAIEAISLLPPNINISLTIIGDGSYKKNLEQLTIKLGIRSKVVFTGYMKQDLALEEIRNFHAAIIPHYRSVQTDNSSPNKLFQYMMMGIPVISSDCQSLVRIINETECGITYRNKSASDLASKLTNLYEKPELLKKLSINSHKSIVNQLNTEKENLNLISLYKWLNL